MLYAGLAGAVLSGCACATMPMAEGIKAQGARLGTVTAFIVISPLLSPVTLWLTYGMLGWRWTLARLLVPFVFSVALGAGLNMLERAGAGEFVFPGSTTQRRGAISLVAARCAAFSPVHPVLRGLWEILRTLAPYFFLGVALAALLITFGRKQRFRVTSVAPVL